MRRARREKEHGIAARPVTGNARGFFGNFGWALALAGRRRRTGRGGRGCRLGIGTGPLLLPTAAVAPGLVAAALFAVGGGPIALRGMPAPPAAGGVTACGAAVPCLGPLGEEPALATLE